MSGVASPGRLKWRCRRGMRELDVLLERYLDRDYPQADGESRQAFEQLLEMSDPQLKALLLNGGEASHPIQQRVIDALCRPAS